MHKKILKKLYFFSRVSKNLSMNTRITVYNTIIKPHFEYCATIVYSFDLNKISVLQRMQNRAMRIILRCNKYTPITIMLNSLQWMSIKERLYFLSMIFIYKILHNKLPGYFDQFIVYNHQIHEHETRSRNQLHIYRKNKSRSMKTLFFKGFDQYNKLPKQVTESKSICEFRRNMLAFLGNTSCTNN
jgi:hypothetical protein